MPEEKRRPPPRDERVNLRLDQETKQLGEERAQREGRTFSQAIRALVWWWAREELPANYTPPTPPDDDTRAQKRPRPKRRPQRK